MKCRLILLCIFTSLCITACHGPGVKEYRTANEAYARGDYQTSFVNYLYAANQDLVPAEYAVGYQYYYGLGTKRNESEGITWLQRAAPHSVEAQYALHLIQENRPKEPWLINWKK